MSTDRIHAILDDFADQIRAEVQRQAVAALSGGFESTPARSSTAPRTARAVSSKGVGKGTKRDPALIDKLQGQLLSFVKQNPGLRIEQINKQLGTTTKELALPIRKLIAAKAIRTSGEKRSTSYSAAGGGAKKTVANKTVKRKASKPSKRKASKPSKRAAKSAPTAPAAATDA